MSWRFQDSVVCILISPVPKGTAIIFTFFLPALGFLFTFSFILSNQPDRLLSLKDMLFDHSPIIWNFIIQNSKLFNKEFALR